jgi:hypothetical protein
MSRCRTRYLVGTAVVGLTVVLAAAVPFAPKAQRAGRATSLKQRAASGTSLVQPVPRVTSLSMPVVLRSPTNGPAARSWRIAEGAFGVLRVHSGHVQTAHGLGAVVALSRRGITVRVTQETNGNICLATISATETSGMACAQAQHAATSGIDLVLEDAGQPTRITILVPDGVGNVAAVAEGKDIPIAVTNNIATATLSGVQSVTYSLPDGKRVTLAVPPPPRLPPTLRVAPPPRAPRSA